MDAASERATRDTALQRGLAESTRFAVLQHVDRCTSTQDLAAAAELPEGAGGVFWADEQTGGRGREGRGWDGAPRRDLEVTFRVDGLRLERPGRLAPAVPLAMLVAIESCSAQRLAFKWPNDIHAGGRKLCGTLIDFVGGGGGRYRFGVGVNVNRTGFPPELRDHATSLCLLTGHEFDRHALVARLAAALEAALGALQRGDDGTYASLLRARAQWFGRRVRVERAAAGPLEGRVVELDLDHLRIVPDGPATPGVDVPLGVIERIVRA